MKGFEWLSSVLVNEPGFKFEAVQCSLYKRTNLVLSIQNKTKQ